MRISPSNSTNVEMKSRNSIIKAAIFASAMAYYKTDDRWTKPPIK
jgi:hypothetical protein